ncbi:unnamed protein product [Penicillium salamii]|uniref:Zn(2)-C6 fungal-type domain-containing protein n=1 Tax=Penicillium salamii TaxID=1612424 RepID=A0A9W4NEJ2_9EURO|nr:unnamed protein product [Penicillium salamii]CAG8044349.1 unnamed protein product [Penicillium salamii]CAG8067639.1 unnamed protein product [Penicillium salamii]CAG8222626.1 unnamed protein product [Penicillium salamii]CAG8266187.1 unnamed protein product [Penicillium salamii]
MAQDRKTTSSLPREGGSTLLRRSCHDCNRRKVRCNKSLPCNNCERLGFECSYPPPGRKPRKIIKKASNKTELVSRLGFLEDQIKQLGGKVFEEESPNGPPVQENDVDVQESRAVRSWLDKQSPRGGVSDQSGEVNESELEISKESVSPKASSSTLENQFGRLVVDRNSGTSRYVNHRVLTELADQIKEVRDLFDSPESPTLSEEDSWTSVSAADQPDVSSPFIFGYHSVAHSLTNYHPPPIISHLLFNAFQENVAPIILIIHKPMLKELLKTAITNPEDSDKESEALVFSIYLAAIYSLSPEACLAQLGTDHATMTKRYRFAVEQALVRAGFLHTRKLVVLQAAVLFLTCACDPQDAHFVWTMIAVVTRLALSLGLHRDGSHFDLGPFETEMRRRLWWYIYLLDVRSSDSQATSPQIREGDYDTLLPLNINDDDLSPDMAETPLERTGFTEMTLTLVRCEILKLHRKLMQSNNVVNNEGHNALFQTRLQAIEETRIALDERYLQYCDLDIAIHWVTATIGRVALARSWLVSHFSLMTVKGFQRGLIPGKCDLLIFTAIEVLEFVYLLESHENTTKWSWLFQGYVQWQAFAFVLSELCVRPTSSLSERAWAAVDRVYERWHSPMGNRLGLMMRPLKPLRNRAAAIRAQYSDQSRGSIAVSNLDSDVGDLAPDMANPTDIQGDLELESLDIFMDVVNTIGL